MGIKKIGNIILIQLSDIDSNIYVIGDTVIDSGTGFNFTRMYSAMKALKIDLKSINQVINTHGHFDHIGGNGYFINAKIMIHEKDAHIIEKGNNEDSYADFFDGKVNPKAVNTKLKDGDKIVAGELELEVMHTPGHTPGSICLFDKKSGILFSGDTMFSDGVGRIDMPGGNEQDMESSLEKIQKLDGVQKILPGHGDLVLANAKKVIQDILSG